MLECKGKWLSLKYAVTEEIDRTAISKPLQQYRFIFNEYDDHILWLLEQYEITLNQSNHTVTTFLTTIVCCGDFSFSQVSEYC